MQKKIFFRILTIAIAGVLLSTAVLVAAHTLIIGAEVKANAESTLSHAERLYMDNKSRVAEIKTGYYQSCLSRARALAEYIRVTPETADDDQRLSELCVTFRVDEIHIIDENGIIRHSNIPKNINYDMKSAAQSNEFMQIIGNPSTEIAQEVMPNGYEAKLVSYSGVSRKDKPGIIQIGVYDSSVQKAVNGAEIMEVIAQTRFGDTGSVMVLDNFSGTILAHPDESLIGDKVSLPQNGKAAYINGANQIVYSKAVDYSYTFAATMPVSEIVSTCLLYTLIYFVVIVVLFVAVTAAVMRAVRKEILTGLGQINDNIDTVLQGDYGAEFKVGNAPEFERFAVSLKALTKLIVDQHREIESLNMIDPVTGLANETKFQYSLGREWERYRRGGGLISLILIQIDEYRAYAENFGAPAADMVIASVADIISAAAKRPFDLVAYLDDGKFAVLLPETDADGSEKVADIIRGKFDREPNGGRHAEHERITLSLGIADIAPSSGHNASELKVRAENALYNAIINGGNKTELFNGNAQ
ncbi:MAG: diguanylate cyclase [Oscillospiraceae bacterium]|jgi:diguanylate cyclase (GGDEF)-like protein|nr:diguanylate cyclase [Oscillospiraceae bacterium]